MVSFELEKKACLTAVLLVEIDWPKGLRIFLGLGVPNVFHTVPKYGSQGVSQSFLLFTMISKFVKGEDGKGWWMFCRVSKVDHIFL
jgi:hypothetical protein